ncbi:MAG: hypothetical protein KGJ86_03395 [Chloroflexota bacterium]|nr:hypothetical protein [Chloroflexota bacterium]
MIGLAGSALTFGAFDRLHIRHLPGHIGVVLLAALLVARLGTGNRLGALGGAAGALPGAVWLGGDPLQGLGLVAAGVIVDVQLNALPWSSAGRLRWAVALPSLIVAGALGNTAILALKVLTAHVPQAAQTQGIGFTAASYLVFGGLGGLLALPAATIHARGRPSDTM